MCLFFFGSLTLLGIAHRSLCDSFNAVPRLPFLGTMRSLFLKVPQLSSKKLEKPPVLPTNRPLDSQREAQSWGPITTSGCFPQCQASTNSIPKEKKRRTPQLRLCSGGSSAGDDERLRCVSSKERIGFSFLGGVVTSRHKTKAPFQKLRISNLLKLQQPTALAITIFAGVTAHAEMKCHLFEKDAAAACFGTF